MSLLVFDVNETLLDLAPVRAGSERIFGDAGAAGRWFAQLIQLAMVATITGRYQDFSTLAAEALNLTAQRAGRELRAADRDAVLGAMLQLPAHPDVLPALRSLQGAGFRLAALSNSSEAALSRQLEFAGIGGMFEQAISVDTVRVFKPHPAVYREAARRLGAEPSRLRLVAAHNWDLTGAVRAGLRGAFVARPGSVRGALDEPVDISGPSLTEVARRILETDRPE
jgi:2-haloacid dehalogenase